jgi:hypothetical protein
MDMLQACMHTHLGGSPFFRSLFLVPTPIAHPRLLSYSSVESMDARFNSDFLTLYRPAILNHRRPSAFLDTTVASVTRPSGQQYLR